MKRSRSVRGGSLVEFALIFPLLFLLIVNVVNFGAYIYAWVSVANAARTGAQYLVMSAATIAAPRPATADQVTAIITADGYSLLNKASLAVRICKNNNGTITCSGAAGSNPPADPEPTKYVLASVDVTYTYNPFISLWSYPALGIYATIPSSTIHRRAVMRMMQ